MISSTADISTLSLSNMPETRETCRARTRLIILHHPDATRVGAVAMLPELDHGRTVSLSRLEPWFKGAQTDTAGALNDPFVSRRPLTLEPNEDGVLLDAPRSAKLTIQGKAAVSATVTAEDLRNGVVLGLGGRVLLSLLRGPVAPPIAPEMIGQSPAMVQLRSQIKAYADSDLPVLIHGETGSGKEGIARALHAGSARRTKPYLAVNASTIRPELAASTLFGHKRGAFTGADADRSGAFVDANGGTLFLDEIGDLPSEVQPMLLRAIEQGEIQPVGGQPRQVNVRVLAASERDLACIPGFRAALRFRVAQLEIGVPPLRGRAADIPLLVHHFLRHSPAASRLDAKDAPRPWLTPRALESLMAQPWPGNVRELGAMMQRYALQYADLPEAPALPAAAMWPDIDPSPIPDAVPSCSDTPLIEVLREVRGNVSEAARALGVSRNTIISRMRRQGIPLATDLPKHAVREALERAHGDVDVAAAKLGVSAHGLRLVVSRMQED